MISEKEKWDWGGVITKEQFFYYFSPFFWVNNFVLFLGPREKASLDVHGQHALTLKSNQGIISLENYIN